MKAFTKKIFGDYRLEETVFESSNSFIVRAVKNGDRYIIKFPREDSPKTRTKYTKEFETAKLFDDNPYVVKYHSCEKHKNGVALIIEDFRGISMEDYIRKHHKVKLFKSFLFNLSHIFGGFSHQF